MRDSILAKAIFFVGLCLASFFVRLALVDFMFAKPIGQINTTISKQLQTAMREMDAATPREYSTRNAFKTDAEWEQSTSARQAYHHPATIVSDDAATATSQAANPVAPASSWVLFNGEGPDGSRNLHARLSLADPDGRTTLAIELSQPQPAHGDTGGVVQISLAAVTQANCAGTDGLVLRFDTAEPVRYATSGVWADGKCRLDVPGFAHFRDAVINASMLFIRLAKGPAMTQEIAAPVAGLSWSP